MSAAPRDSKMAEGEALVPAMRDNGDDIITASEMARLVEPVAEMISKVNWDMLPKILATALAIRIFIQENEAEIAARSQGILNKAKKKP